MSARVVIANQLNGHHGDRQGCTGYSGCTTCADDILAALDREGLVVVSKPAQDRMAMSYSNEEIAEMSKWISSYADLTGDVKDPWQLGNFKKIGEMMQQLQSDLEDARRIGSDWFLEQQKQRKQVEYLTGYLKGWKDQTRADFADLAELNNTLVDALKRIEEAGTVESMAQTLIAIDALRRVTPRPSGLQTQAACLDPQPS